MEQEEEEQQCPLSFVDSSEEDDFETRQEGAQKQTKQASRARKESAPEQADRDEEGGTPRSSSSNL